MSACRGRASWRICGWSPIPASTHPRHAPAEAWQRVEEWLARPGAWIPAPGSRHRPLLGEIIENVGPTGNLVPDAHLAALAREHGLTIVSADTDFGKFRDVAWLNPVTGEERRSSSLGLRHAEAVPRREGPGHSER